MFKVGDYVRIKVEKQLFEKGYTANWSREIYIISKILATQIPQYKLITIDSKTINKKFYTEQIQKIAKPEFPYDTYQVLDQQGSRILVRKLNDEETEDQWVEKKTILPTRKSSRLANLVSKKAAGAQNKTKATK